MHARMYAHTHTKVDNNIMIQQRATGTVTSDTS